MLVVTDAYTDGITAYFVLSTGEVKEYNFCWMLSPFSSAKDDAELQSLLAATPMKEIHCSRVGCPSVFQRRFRPVHDSVCMQCQAQEAFDAPIFAMLDIIEAVEKENKSNGKL